MTMTSGSDPASMRYSLDEVLSGMLASTTHTTFTNDAARLALVFEGLASSFPMFRPFAAGVDPAAVEQALKKLETRKILQQQEGKFVLTVDGRAACASGKRTLFNAADRAQLEEAARAFDAAIS
jgi:hypothetical protein